jgi:hypothetical protein
VSADFRVTGADQIARAARALKAQGPGGVQGRKELLRAIQSGTKELKADIKASARSSLPTRGGLNEVIAQSPISTRTRTTGNSVGVRIVATGKPLRDIEATNRGRLRHPVFGNRKVWVQQTIPAGWFDRPLQAGAPKVRTELLAAMQRIIANVTRGSR